MRHTTIVAASSLLLLLPAACVTEGGFRYADAEWTKQGATRDDFERDLAHCEQREGATEVSASDAMQGCLRELGWSRFGDRSVYDRARETLPSR